MEVQVTSATNKIARQFKLSVEELAFADLCAVGWEPEDAWAIAIRKGVTWTKSVRKEEVAHLRNSPAVVERMDAVQAVLKKNQIEAVRNTKDSDRQNIINAAMSKEQMLFDLQEALMSMQRGSKEWLDTKKLIVDVTRMKSDEVREEKSTIHHYLPVNYPVSCEYCLRNPENQRGIKKKAPDFHK